MRLPSSSPQMWATTGASSRDAEPRAVRPAAGLKRRLSIAFSIVVTRSTPRSRSARSR